MFKKNQHKLLLPLLCFFFFVGCQSTRHIVDSSIELAEKDFGIPDSLEFDEVEGPYSYIFIRLYEPQYTNPFYIANLLKSGIEVTNVTESGDSHSAINFSLKDNFWGLTSGGKYQLAKESCLQPKRNKYMKNCNPETSHQTTYALKVPLEDFQNTKDFVEAYAKSRKIKYQVWENFRIGFFSIGRKFFTKRSKQQFGNVDYPKPEKHSKKYVENNFVCSTFIAYALQSNVKNVDAWFKEKGINYKYVNVTDLIYIPGMVKLFDSTWDNYGFAVNAFVDKFPEFEKYLDLR